MLKLKLEKIGKKKNINISGNSTVSFLKNRKLFALVVQAFDRKSFETSVR